MNEQNLIELFGDIAKVEKNHANEFIVHCDSRVYKNIAHMIKHHEILCCEQLIDLTVVDMLTYGQSEWETSLSTSEGFGRAVMEQSFDNQNKKDRFIVVVQFLSVKLNHRLRLKVTVGADLSVETLCDLWPSANWFEREAFDLFGVVFRNHPDMRRLLTDYGFVGHPFRKDFPLQGTVEMRFDSKENRCLYEKVSIENRVLVPKVIREQKAKGEKDG